MSKDVCARKHGGVETSVRANEMVDKSTDRTVIYAHIEQATDGLTLDEVAHLLHREVNCLSGRISELLTAGEIEDSGLRRTTRTGATARVYRVARRSTIAPTIEEPQGLLFVPPPFTPRYPR